MRRRLELEIPAGVFGGATFEDAVTAARCTGAATTVIGPAGDDRPGLFAVSYTEEKARLVEIAVAELLSLLEHKRAEATMMRQLVADVKRQVWADPGPLEPLDSNWPMA